MKIWIENKIGYLDGYSLMEQPDQVELEVEQEPLDFPNWRFDGQTLIHDPDNVPEPEPAPPTKLELLEAENKALKAEITETRQETTDAQLAIAELYEMMEGGSVE
ncbi:TPA: hypothetical protein ACGBG5_002946 [Enterococcus faecalis]|uniref:hypothetical protein n=1 Tax=Enterococcus faecalis TaxID=1351 RepID=UPI0036D71709